MSRSAKAVSSLASFPWRRATIYLLPIRSLFYGALSLLIVVALLVVMDRLVLGSLERGGWTASELWARHNKLIEETHRRKTTTNECELRHWTGQPLPKVAGTLHVPTDGNGTGSVPATDERHTILVMGDSFVWGPPYITLNHLWWRQLAIELERRGYHQVDVVAAGHPGWSTRRQLECAQHLIPEVKPDLVIWGYVTNDPDEKIVPQIFDSQDQPPYGQRIRRQLQRLIPNLAFKFESLRANKLAAQYTGPEYGYAYPDWELRLLEDENFERYRGTIQEVGALMRQSNTPAFLLTLPHFPGREYFEPRYAPVMKEWQAAGITVDNTLDEFVRRYGDVSATGPESLRWGINPADSHPGPRATHFHAVMAADFLEAHWPETLGPKDTTEPHELAINDWLPFDLNVRKVSEETRDVVIAPSGSQPPTPKIGQVVQQSYELEYPATTALMPQLPLDEPTVLVALRYPLPLTEIHLEGPGLANVRVWVSTLDPAEQYDENRWREVGKFYGDQPDGWFAYFTAADILDRPVAEIRFSAAIRGPSRRLTLTLTRHTSAQERP